METRGGVSGILERELKLDDSGGLPPISVEGFDGGRQFRFTVPGMIHRQFVELAEELEITEMEIYRRVFKVGLLLVRSQQEKDLSFLIENSGVVESRKGTQVVTLSKKIKIHD